MSWGEKGIKSMRDLLIWFSSTLFGVWLRMDTKIVFTLCLIVVAKAQVPGFGRCPEYDAMADFNKEKFLGRWIEIERYFTVSEVISKCISVDYERRADGNIHVKNYYTNRM